MEPLPVFHKLTVRLNEILQTKMTAKHQQKRLDEVNQLIDQRGQILHLLDKPVRADDKVMMKEILAMETHIQERLEQDFEQLKTEIRLNKKHQTSAQKYSNPYGAISSNDGIFLDRKK